MFPKSFVGPALGAWLYNIGGFQLPFLIFGSISTVSSMLLIATVPSQIESIATKAETIQETSEESLLMKKNNNHATLNCSCEERVGNYTNMDTDSRRGSCILLNKNVFMNPQPDVKSFG